MKSGVQLLDPVSFRWLEDNVERQIKGCQVPASDGTILFTPDGMGNYKALWTRDFCYMVENAFELMKPQLVKAAIVYLLNGQRKDGCIPDRVEPGGRAVYSPGPVDKPMSDYATDNAQFIAKLVYEYVRRTGDREFLKAVESKVLQGLHFLSRTPDGLIWNDPNNPQCPYGFTDCIAKTGKLFFSSLLYWEACKDMAEICGYYGAPDAAQYQEEGETIKRAMDLLWDNAAGMYLAATIDCRQIDIWGSAYAVYLGFPTDERKDKISNYFLRHYEEIIQNGQVRHLPDNEHWKRMFVNVPEGEYQNGAFWATASGWVLYTIARVDIEKAKKMASDLIAYYQKFGIFECTNKDYLKLNNYVASATNPYGALKKIMRGE